MPDSPREKNAKRAGALLFTGCLFIGMAAGWYLDMMHVGLFGGMGVGFLFMAITRLIAQKI